MDVSEKETGETAAEADETPRRGALRGAVDNPYMVLGFCFFAAMFLGCPFIWASRGFSKPMKVFWTVVVLIYSALVLGLFGYVMYLCYESIRSAFQSN